MSIPKRHTIILADDHALFRQGLRLILTGMEGMEVVADVSNGKELLKLIPMFTPDLVIMDINMPVMDGLEASRIMGIQNPEIPILVVSMYSDEQYYMQAIENGVRGFIKKDAENEEFRRAIQALVSGRTYFSQELLQRLVERKEIKAETGFTPREKDVLALTCRGMTTEEIAARLFISLRTVENHKRHLLEKTGCRNTMALVLHAYKNRLFEDEESEVR